MSRLRPALERLHDDGLDTGASSETDPDAFTRQAERVHWVRSLAKTCARLGIATPTPETDGPMTRLADAAAVTAVLHADVLTNGQRWAIVASLARSAKRLVTAAGGGDQSSPDVDRALMIAEASSGVLFQFAALDPPAAIDYAALHRLVPDPSAHPTSPAQAALEASAALVHATRAGTGPHLIADVLAIATACRTVCAFAATAADEAGGRDVAGLARDAVTAWGDVREQLAPFNDGSRRPQVSRPPSVEHALRLHRELQPDLAASSVPTAADVPAKMAHVVARLATVAEHLEAAVADGVTRGRFMAYAAELPLRESRVAANLSGRKGAGLVTADSDDTAHLRTSLHRARLLSTELGAGLDGARLARAAIGSCRTPPAGTVRGHRRHRRGLWIRVILSRMDTAARLAGDDDAAGASPARRWASSRFARPC